MYYCTNCKKEFMFAKVYYERAGTGVTDYERFLLCPHCDSNEFYEKKGGYCRCCGIKIRLPSREYCSESCRKNGERLWQRQKERQMGQFVDPLVLAVKEVDDYNKSKGCKLSYGQYYALKGANRI